MVGRLSIPDEGLVDQPSLGSSITRFRPYVPSAFTPKDETEEKLLEPVAQLEVSVERFLEATRMGGQTRRKDLSGSFYYVQVSLMVHHISTVLLNPMLVHITEPVITLALGEFVDKWSGDPTSASLWEAMEAVGAALRSTTSEGSTESRFVPRAWYPVHNALTSRHYIGHRIMIYVFLCIIAIIAVLASTAAPKLRGSTGATVLGLFAALFCLGMTLLLIILDHFNSYSMPSNLIDELTSGSWKALGSRPQQRQTRESTPVIKQRIPSTPPTPRTTAIDQRLRSSLAASSAATIPPLSAVHDTLGVFTFKATSRNMVLPLVCQTEVFARIAATVIVDAGSQEVVSVSDRAVALLGVDASAVVGQRSSNVLVTSMYGGEEGSGNTSTSTTTGSGATPVEITLRIGSKRRISGLRLPATLHKKEPMIASATNRNPSAATASQSAHYIIYILLESDMPSTTAPYQTGPDLSRKSIDIRSVLDDLEALREGIPSAAEEVGKAMDALERCSGLDSSHTTDNDHDITAWDSVAAIALTAAGDNTLLPTLTTPVTEGEDTVLTPLSAGTIRAVFNALLVPVVEGRSKVTGLSGAVSVDPSFSICITAQYDPVSIGLSSMVTPALEGHNVLVELGPEGIVLKVPKTVKHTFPRRLNPTLGGGLSFGGSGASVWEQSAAARMNRSVGGAEERLAIVLAGDADMINTFAVPMWERRHVVSVAPDLRSLSDLLQTRSTYVDVAIVDIDLPGLTHETTVALLQTLATRTIAIYFYSSSDNFPENTIPESMQLQASKMTPSFIDSTLYRAIAYLSAKGRGVSPPVGAVPSTTTFTSASKLPHFVLGDKIGSGAYGDVFEIYYPVTGGKAALKRIFLKSDDATQLAEIKREVEIMKGVDHPNLVSFIYSYQGDDAYALILELCERDSLAERLIPKHLKYISNTAAVVRIIKDIVSGLVYIHSKGIVHRDIKPGNVLFRDGVAKIADFGTAIQDQEGGVTPRTGTMRGTLGFMAPEVMLGEPYNRAADIWSLGCLLADVLGLDLPHMKSMNMVTMSIMYQSMTMEDHVFVSDELEVPRPISDLIEMCLHRDIAKRPTAEYILSHPIVWDVDLVGAACRKISERRSAAQSAMSFDMSLKSGAASSTAATRSENL